MLCSNRVGQGNRKKETGRQGRRSKRSIKNEAQEQPEAIQSLSRAELIDKAIKNLENKMTSNDVRATVGDFIRLLQLQKELEQDSPREIKVTWVDPDENKADAEK